MCELRLSAKNALNRPGNLFCYSQGILVDQAEIEETCETTAIKKLDCVRALCNVNEGRQPHINEVLITNRHSRDLMMTSYKLSRSARSGHPS